MGTALPARVSQTVLNGSIKIALTSQACWRIFDALIGEKHDNGILACGWGIAQCRFEVLEFVCGAGAGSTVSSRDQGCSSAAGGIKLIHALHWQYLSDYPRQYYCILWCVLF